MRTTIVFDGIGPRSPGLKFLPTETTTCIYRLWAVLEALRFFLVILGEGSLRCAAERLHISQPALTRHMQLLEHDLGGRLLERTSAGVRPTGEGHALAEKTRRS
jgi:regulatory helix-turn-helix LysR family protein